MAKRHSVASLALLFGIALAMSHSTLSSVVSNLVRAQMGSSVTPTVQDDDLDRHVAELILKEAKQKAARYQQDGIRAYLSRKYVHCCYAAERT